MADSVERYLNKTNATEVFQTIKSYILSHSGGGGGGGGSDEPVDGDYVINRDSSGDISSIVFTYNGGVKTTTFVETSTSKIITEHDAKTGATTATVVTTTITGDAITVRTTTVPVS